jgi:hypothetical protein
MTWFQAQRDESRRQLRDRGLDSGFGLPKEAMAFFGGADFGRLSSAAIAMPSTNPAAAKGMIGPEFPVTSLAFRVGFRFAPGPNQAPEPTTTSGTVAAEPLGVPVAVVAHL